jgi:hypothetical protein
VVARWVENPYYQHFSGEMFFQHCPPIDPSSLTRWRRRIGEEGVEWLLIQTIQAGQKFGVIDEDSSTRVAVDTTVKAKYIAHTLREALDQVEILTDHRPELAVVDRGYRGHDEGKTRVLISGTHRGLTAIEIIDLRRRSAIETAIGHMKTDRRLSRCPPKGATGDAIFAVLNACGHSIQKILAHLRSWLAWIIAALWAAETRQQQRYMTAEPARRLCSG